MTLYNVKDQTKVNSNSINYNNNQSFYLILINLGGIRER